MQIWMEINVVTLHKVFEAMPQQMDFVIKVKGGLLQKASATLFWTGSVYCLFKANENGKIMYTIYTISTLLGIY